jgi:SulP family sulfate permease
VADRRAAARRLANFISPAALRGFTSGAAALIVAAQPAEPARHRRGEHRLAPLLRRCSRTCPSSRSRPSAVAAFTIAATLVLRRTWPSAPQMLIALVAATALAAAINRWWPGARAGGGVAVLGSVPRSGRSFQWPAFDPARLPDLLASPSP